MAEQKREIRRKYKKLRENMVSQEVTTRSRCICGHILSSDVFRKADMILAYYPLGNEADVRPVVEAAWRQRKCVAFPKVFGDEMWFFPVQDFSELHPGTFGVMEPDGELPIFERKRLDGNFSTSILMLVPGVAFDKNKNRMGFGKGYYDRYLAWMKSSGNFKYETWNESVTRLQPFYENAEIEKNRDVFQPEQAQTRLVTLGVAYELQIADWIPTESTDIPLDFLVTEHGIF